MGTGVGHQAEVTGLLPVAWLLRNCQKLREGLLFLQSVTMTGTGARLLA